MPPPAAIPRGEARRFRWASCPTMATRKKTGSRSPACATADQPTRPGSRTAIESFAAARKPVGTIYDYMEIMTQFKPGDQLEVVVVRDGKEVKLDVKLGRRPA